MGPREAPTRWDHPGMTIVPYLRKHWGINAIVSGDAGFSPHSTTWM
jgi:hypothetical protein